MKRVVIYIRVSTLDQAREGYSLDAQRHALEGWAAAHDCDVVNVYEDAGISGKDIAHRPAMIKMLEDSKLNKFDLILVWALSRLTRSVTDLYTTWELLKANGVSLVCYTESFDTGTPTG